MHVQQRILRMIDVQDSFSARTGRDVLEDETFNFSFQLQKARYVLDEALSYGEERQFNSLLPSSIGVFGPYCQHAVEQSCCQAETVVKYEIEARVYCGDDCISSASQAVRIFDCPVVHPAPVHTEHFPGEYVCKSEQRLKTMYRISKPVLTISSSEPRPVEIRANGDVAMAAISLQFTLRGVNAPPGNLDVSINSILKATTFLSAVKMTSQPTIKNSKVNSFMAAVPKWGRSYHRKLHITEWTRGNDPRAKSWSANAMVWMPVSEGATPAPTFWTPFLARRYSAGLRVEVGGSVGKGIFQLCVPVQVVYPEINGEVPSYETAMSTPVSEVEDFEFGSSDVLPIYVR